MKLYALYLGGRAEGCNIELHDVQFFVGKSIKSLYPTILKKWFGKPEKCHIDSWVELKYLDGYNIVLRKEKPQNQGVTLYFINLGGYESGSFTELHACQFLIAKNDNEAKQRAKSNLLVGKQQVHTDDLYDVDDCLQIQEVDGYHIHLEVTKEHSRFEPNNGYHKLPKQVISEYLSSQ